MSIPLHALRYLVALVLLACACTGAESGSPETLNESSADGTNQSLSQDPEDSSVTVPDPVAPTVSLQLETAFSQVIVEDGEPGTEIRAIDAKTGEVMTRSNVSESGSAALLGLSQGTVELEVWDGDRLVAAAGSVVLPGGAPTSATL